MQRVHGASFHRAHRREQRLRQHLTAEDLRRADAAARAAVQVDLEPFELVQLQQFAQFFTHDRAADRAPQSPEAETPRRCCITGLVVVYCRNCFFCG